MLSKFLRLSCFTLLLTGALGACKSPSAPPAFRPSNSPSLQPSPEITSTPEPPVKQLVKFNPEALPQEIKYSTRLYTSFNNLGFKLLRTLHQKYPTQNIVFSPELIGSSLIQLYFWATPEVQQSILALLEIDAQTLEQEYPYFAKEAFHKDLKTHNMSIRHALWLPQNPDLDEAQQQQLQVQGMELFLADFTNPETITAMHNWYLAASDKTPLPGLTPSILLKAPAIFNNTAAFEGLWDYEYNQAYTRKAKFWLQPGQSIQADMMHNYSPEHGRGYSLFTYSFVNAPDIQILGAGGRFFQFRCFLPAQHSSVSEQLNNIDTARYEDLIHGDFAEKYNKFPDSGFRYRMGKVSIPKLNLEQALNLEDVLLDLDNPNTEEILKLNALLSKPTGIKSAELKSRLELDEKGISAASSLQIEPLAQMDSPFEFSANRPFFFTIDNANVLSEVNRIYYMGVVMDPTQP